MSKADHKEISEVVSAFREGHARMLEVVSMLSEQQMTEEPVLDEWTVKDIIAHLAAWSIDARLEIDRVLNDAPAWVKLYDSDEGVTDFNERAIATRRFKQLSEVIEEWKAAFEAEMSRVESLTDDEWNHQSGTDVWKDGNKVTVFSLYSYEYLGEQHEAAHARQIKNHFGLNTHW